MFKRTKLVIYLLLNIGNIKKILQYVGKIIEVIRDRFFTKKGA